MPIQADDGGVERVERPRGVTIRAIAKRSGVSPATVSRVLNGHPYVRDEVRKRVERSLQQLGYRPDRRAHGRAAARTGSLGLVVPDILNPFYAEASNVLIATCRARGYNVTLCTSENLPALQREQVELLRKRRVDAIIFGSVLYDDPEAEALIASGYPCIQFNRRLRSGRGNYVVTDNLRAGQEVTAHLTALGHRRIGFIGGAAEASTVQERLQGYLEALEAAGLPVDEKLIRQGAYKTQAALQAAEDLLKRGDRPTAIVGGSDAIALSVLQIADELRLEVPADLAVVGIDDIGIAAHRRVQLTTVSQHAATMAEIAANWAVEIAQDPARFVRQPFQYVIRPTLIVRQTCGAELARRDAGGPEDSRA